MRGTAGGAPIRLEAVGATSTTGAAPALAPNSGVPQKKSAPSRAATRFEQRVIRGGRRRPRSGCCFFRPRLSIRAPRGETPRDLARTGPLGTLADVEISTLCRALACRRASPTLQLAAGSPTRATRVDNIVSRGYPVPHRKDLPE
jgi:hypothetical protein